MIFPKLTCMKTSIRLLAIIALTVLEFAFSLNTQAVVPPPDGGYPGGNTAEGQAALLNLTSGTFNSAVGFGSLRSNTFGSFNTGIGAGTLFANTGDENTGTGAGALLSNTTGIQNTANGAFALFSNTTGGLNTATGRNALLNNTTGDGNTASGAEALLVNTTGNNNTADGGQALFTNTTGQSNTAIGATALSNNTTGDVNTAIGAGALYNNTIGTRNTASGVNALPDNDTGNSNTADGTTALFLNTTGNNNTANGDSALFSNTAGSGNTAIGASALPNSTGSGSIAIGYNSGALVGSSNNVIAIGSPGDDVDNSCFIGNIRGVTTQNADAIAVVIDSAGQLGTMSSSRRFKKEIKPMEKASEAILSLKPVTFHYKSDRTDTPQFGLIAEEVAEVNRNLVARDKNGDIYTVRYDAVNAMLLNEFLKEHRRVEELKSAMAQQRKDFEAAIVQQQKTTEALVTRLNEQEARIQKVSAQVEMRKLGSQMLVENQ